MTKKKSLIPALLLAFFAGTAHAKDNKEEVENALRQKGGKLWIVKHFDHEEYLKFLASLVSGTPEIYVADVAKDVAKTVGKEIAGEVWKRILKGEAAELAEYKITAGLAAVNHSHRIVHHEPRVRWRGPKSYIEWCEVEHELPLPNTFLLWVRASNKKTDVKAAPEQSGQEIIKLQTPSRMWAFALQEDGRVCGWWAESSGARGGPEPFNARPGQKVVGEVTAVVVGSRVWLFARQGDGKMVAWSADDTAQDPWKRTGPEAFDARPGQKVVGEITATVVGTRVWAFAKQDDGKVVGWSADDSAQDHTKRTGPEPFDARPGQMVVGGVTAVVAGSRVWITALQDDGKMVAWSADDSAADHSRRTGPEAFNARPGTKLSSGVTTKVIPAQNK